MKVVVLTTAELNDALEALAVRRHGLDERRDRLLLEGEAREGLSVERLEQRAARLRELEDKFSRARESGR